MSTPGKQFARASGRTSREAWEELQRLKNLPRFDKVLAYLDRIDGTLRISDVERAVKLAEEGDQDKAETLIEGIPSLSGAAVRALHETLDAAIAAQGTDRGNIQVVDQDGALRIAAQRAFAPDFLEHFSCVRVDGSSACARSLRAGNALVIPDVYEDPAFALHLELAKRSGFRAVQSIPLLSGSGSVIGMLSVHYESPLPSSHWRMQSLQESAARAAAVLNEALAAPGTSTAPDPGP